MSKRAAVDKGPGDLIAEDALFLKFTTLIRVDVSLDGYARYVKEESIHICLTSVLSLSPHHNLLIQEGRSFDECLAPSYLAPHSFACIQFVT